MGGTKRKRVVTREAKKRSIDLFFSINNIRSNNKNKNKNNNKNNNNNNNNNNSSEGDVISKDGAEEDRSQENETNENEFQCENDLLFQDIFHSTSSKTVLNKNKTNTIVSMELDELNGEYIIKPNSNSERDDPILRLKKLRQEKKELQESMKRVEEARKLVQAAESGGSSQTNDRTNLPDDLTGINDKADILELIKESKKQKDSLNHKERMLYFTKIDPIKFIRGSLPLVSIESNLQEYLLDTGLIQYEKIQDSDLQHILTIVAYHKETHIIRKSVSFLSRYIAGNPQHAASLLSFELFERIWQSYGMKIDSVEFDIDKEANEVDLLQKDSSRENQCSYIHNFVHLLSVLNAILEQKCETYFESKEKERNNLFFIACLLCIPNDILSCTSVEVMRLIFNLFHYGYFNKDDAPQLIDQFNNLCDKLSSSHVTKLSQNLLQTNDILQDVIQQVLFRQIRRFLNTNSKIEIFDRLRDHAIEIVKLHKEIQKNEKDKQKLIKEYNQKMVSIYHYLNIAVRLFCAYTSSNKEFFGENEGTLNVTDDIKKRKEMIGQKLFSLRDAFSNNNALSLEVKYTATTLESLIEIEFRSTSTQMNSPCKPLRKRQKTLKECLQSSHTATSSL